jgi:acyl carrier protein
MSHLLPSAKPAQAEIDARLRGLIADTLGLGSAPQGWQGDTPLLGVLPELDSLGVASLLTALEDCFGFLVHDEDVSAETFETYGSLLAFVSAKATHA